MLLAGIPMVADAEFNIDTSLKNEWSWGTQTSFTRTYRVSFPIKAGPNQTIHAKSTVSIGTLEVPFTVHLVSKSNEVKVQTTGVWRGVSSWDLRHTITKM